jgi:hypothetical protein
VSDHTGMACIHGYYMNCPTCQAVTDLSALTPEELAEKVRQAIDWAGRVGEGSAALAELVRRAERELESRHEQGCAIYRAQPPWKCSCGLAAAEAELVRRAANLTVAIEQRMAAEARAEKYRQALEQIRRGSASRAKQIAEDALAALDTLEADKETLHIDGCSLPGGHEGPCDVDEWKFTTEEARPFCLDPSHADKVWLTRDEATSILRYLHNRGSVALHSLLDERIGDKP